MMHLEKQGIFVLLKILPLMCALILFLTGQAPTFPPDPSPKQILSLALGRLFSYPVPEYVVWTSYWYITRTAPQLVTSTTGGWTNKTSAWHRAERFAERTSDGLQNVTWSIPGRMGQLPDAHFSSVFEGPFAWTLRSKVTAQRQASSPMHPDISGLKTIATVTAHAQPAYALDLIGIEVVDGHNAYHLQTRALTDPDLHNLRDVWVDTATFDIWKAHFVGSYPALVPYGTSPLVRSDITAYFREALVYWIAYRLTWTYDYDGSNFTFDTQIGEIAFPGALPDWLFDATAYAEREEAKGPDILYPILQGVPIPTPSWY